MFRAHALRSARSPNRFDESAFEARGRQCLLIDTRGASDNSTRVDFTGELVDLLEAPRAHAVAKPIGRAFTQCQTIRRPNSRVVMPAGSCDAMFSSFVHVYTFPFLRSPRVHPSVVDSQGFSFGTRVGPIIVMASVENDFLNPFGRVRDVVC